MAGEGGVGEGEVFFSFFLSCGLWWLCLALLFSCLLLCFGMWSRVGFFGFVLFHLVWCRLVVCSSCVGVVLSCVAFGWLRWCSFVFFVASSCLVLPCVGLVSSRALLSCLVLWLALLRCFVWSCLFSRGIARCAGEGREIVPFFYVLCVCGGCDGVD